MEILGLDVFTRYGTVPEQVLTVSANAVTDEKRRPPAQLRLSSFCGRP